VTWRHVITVTRLGLDSENYYAKNVHPALILQVGVDQKKGVKQVLGVTILAFINM
jgi:hypothetical protein